MRACSAIVRQYKLSIGESRNSCSRRTPRNKLIHSSRHTNKHLVPCGKMIQSTNVQSCSCELCYGWRSVQKGRTSMDRHSVLGKRSTPAAQWQPYGVHTHESQRLSELRHDAETRSGNASDKITNPQHIPPSPSSRSRGLFPLH